MASTVFQLSLTITVVTMTIAIATVPTFADEIPSNAVTTSQLGKGKFTVKTTVTPSPNHESRKAAYPRYRVEVRNGSLIKRLYDEMETVTPESVSREAHCSIKEAADVELGALLDAREGAMVTLVAANTRLMAHRAILAARSPVFAAMLCHGSQEASSGEVSIPDVGGPVLRQLLAYLYTLQAPQLPEMAPQLLAAADKFGLSALKAECEVQVAAQLSLETAAATAVLAIKHSSKSLRQAAIAFIRPHLVQVIATQGWADALLSHPYEVVELNRLLAELPVETSTPAAADTHHTTEATSLPQSSQGWTIVAATPVSQPNTNAPSLPHSSQGWTPVAAAAVNLPSTKALSLPNTSHGKTPIAAATVNLPSTIAPSLPNTSHAQTPVAAASSSPPICSPDDAVCHLRSLAPEEKGRRLIKAAGAGSVEEVEALLAAGADIEARDGGRWTALHWAADKGHLEATRRLLQAGAEVDARDRWQWTPLHWAAGNYHTAVTRLLLVSSADPNARDQWGNTSLHWVAANGDAETASALLAAGADRAARDNRGRTPLDIARLNNKHQVIQLLS